MMLLSEVEVSCASPLRRVGAGRASAVLPDSTLLSAACAISVTGVIGMPSHSHTEDQLAVRYSVCNDQALVVVRTPRFAQATMQ